MQKLCLLVFFLLFNLTLGSHKWVIYTDNIDNARQIAKRQKMFLNEDYFKTLDEMFLLEHHDLLKVKDKNEREKMIKDITKALQSDHLTKKVVHQKFRKLYKKNNNRIDFDEWLDTAFTKDKKKITQFNIEKRYDIPVDPLFNKQWYLYNHGQTNGPEGIDINVLGAWNSSNVAGITKIQYFFFQNIQKKKGKGITIALVDDGVQYDHPDLKDSFISSLSV